MARAGVEPVHLGHETVHEVEVHVKRKWLTPLAPADKLGSPGSDGAEVMP
jgi:hypothetical protein